MTEQEPTSMLAKFVERLAKAAERVAAKKKISVEDAKKLLIARAEKIPPLEPKALGKTKDAAKEWTSQAKSKDPNEHARAEFWAKTHPYESLTKDQIKGVLDEAKFILQEKAASVPAFLEVDKITNSPEAARFAAVISLLPKELQDNPQVVYKEAARLYWSTDWMSATPEAVGEVRGVLDRTFEHIRTKLVASNPDFGSAKPVDLWQGLNRKADIYKTQRIKIDTVGEEPPTVKRKVRGEEREVVDKKSAEYKAWEAKWIRMKQQENLDKYLTYTQGELENPLSQHPQQQYDIVKDAVRELERGVKKPLVESRFEPFHIEDKNKVIEQVKAERDRLTLEMQNQVRNRVSREWIIEYYGIVPASNDPDLLTRLNRDQLAMILAGPDDDGETGASKYMELMFDRIFTSSREARPADITDQYEFQEVENVLKYIYGEEGSLSTISRYRDRWNKEYYRNAIIGRLVSGQGGDKELIMEMSRNIPTDTLLYETSVKWSPEAIKAYEEVFFELGVETRWVMDEGAEFVNAKVMARDKFGHMREMTRYRAWVENPGNLRPDEQIKMGQVWRLIGHGSIIRSYLVSQDDPNYFKLVSMQDAIRFKIRFQNVSPEDAFGPHREELAQLFRKVTLSELPADKLNDIDYLENYLNRIRGLSPAEIRAYDKLEASLRLKGIKNIEEKTYKLRRSILSARRYMFGTKRGIVLIGNLSNMVGLDVKPTSGDVMIEGAVEYFLRNEILERFIRRFSIGGENVGLPMWSTGQLQLAEERGFDLANALKRGARLRDGLEGHEPIHMRMARTALTKIREMYGIGYTQLATGTDLGSISTFDGSDWRIEKAIWEVLIEKYGADAKNVAISSQLLMTGYGTEAKDIAKRSPLIDLLTQRTPSKLFHLLGNRDFDNLLRSANVVPGSKEWRQFMTVIGLVEGKIQNQDALIRSTINLGLASDFNRLFDVEVFKALNIVDAGEISILKVKYLKLIQDAQVAFGPYKQVWAKYNLPINLSMTDFNLNDADYMRIPPEQQYRRDVSDGGARFSAKEIRLKVYSSNSIAMPEDPKKELIPAMMEYRGAALGYKDAHFAERTALKLYAQVMSLNEAKWLYRNVAHLFPFVPSAMRAITGQDMSNRWILTLLEPVRRFTIFGANLTGQKELAELLEHSAEEWPTIFGQELVSGAVGATGPSGEALLSLEAHEWIEDLEEAKVITHEHKLLHKLRDQFRTRFNWRLFEVWQRFWWLPWAGAAAVGVIVALQEGDKGQGKPASH